MFRKKRLCTNCKTGKESYELDKHSEACPYIGCYKFKKNRCNYYKPLETEKSLFYKILGLIYPLRK